VWICYDSTGKPTCDKPECKWNPSCPGSEICYDATGNVDCNQPLCKSNPSCPGSEICNDGIDNNGNGLVDCADTGCASTDGCGSGTEICTDTTNKDYECKAGEAGEPCPPGAIQSCDCYCGVHRKCQANGTWGPCTVDDFPVNGGHQMCVPAQITSQSQCAAPKICDFGKCLDPNKDYIDPKTGQPLPVTIGTECVHHADCPRPLICDLGYCKPDNYHPNCP
jgi:hypothetical protein